MKRLDLIYTIPVFIWYLFTGEKCRKKILLLAAIFQENSLSDTNRPFMRSLWVNIHVGFGKTWHTSHSLEFSISKVIIWFLLCVWKVFHIEMLFTAQSNWYIMKHSRKIEIRFILNDISFIERGEIETCRDLKRFEEI